MMKLRLSLLLLVSLMTGCAARQEVEIEAHCRAEGTGSTSCELDTKADRDLKI
jgi:hypothetical protein